MSVRTWSGSGQLQEYAWQLAWALSEEIARRHSAERRLKEVIEAAGGSKPDAKRLAALESGYGWWNPAGGPSALDAVTHLASRESFQACLEREWLRHRRPGRSMGLLLAGVDDFEGFVKIRGRLAGDGCLWRVGRLLAARLPPGGVAARCGDSEFAALLPECDWGEVSAVAKGIRKAVLAAAIAHPGSTAGCLLTVSAVAACHAPHLPGAVTPESLLTMALDGLRRARGLGTGRLDYPSEELLAP